MKASLLFIIIILVTTSVVYDLRVGTLPKDNSSTNDEAPTEMSDDAFAMDEPFQEVIVEEGYTVLRITKALHGGEYPVSKQQILDDFSRLNPEATPKHIMIGHSYRFPLYETDTNENVSNDKDEESSLLQSE
ncbi:hypothetical protein [Texcoconibacillus texcoconensis]|uniref:LysM domain-containing protein n=1 Tax=Texcoconibacillus texcoconensis TaxID=1095777 RepID=A0A840QR23_9BACI|nr:hypothetical protein [Texcoconibacillus texcoconensis]MBB5173902.1 hypothetical protein [Texcoconibacillus texcoconensis]